MGHEAVSGGVAASGLLTGTRNRKFLLLPPSGLPPVPTSDRTCLELTSNGLWELHFPDFQPGIKEHGVEGRLSFERQ